MLRTLISRKGIFENKRFSLISSNSHIALCVMDVTLFSYSGKKKFKQILNQVPNTAISQKRFSREQFNFL